jgi:hypothetical protein
MRQRPPPRGSDAARTTSEEEQTPALSERALAGVCVDRLLVTGLSSHEDLIRLAASDMLQVGWSRNAPILKVPFKNLMRPVNGVEETWRHSFMVASGIGTAVVVLAPLQFEAPFLAACRDVGILVTPVPAENRTRSTIMGRPVRASNEDIVRALESSGCPPQLVSFMKVGFVCDLKMGKVDKNPSGDYLERQGLKMPENMEGQAPQLCVLDNVLCDWDDPLVFECSYLPRPFVDMDVK